MSRRKPATQYEYVAVDIECRSGHRVGLAMKILAGPHAGEFATGRGIRFEESPEPTETSGRLRGKCEQCSADVQVRWGRVLDLLERNEQQGRHTDTLRP